MFVGEVLEPFGARFSERFRPVAVHGIYADGDTVVVLWDGESTRGDGKPYENAYLKPSEKGTSNALVGNLAVIQRAKRARMALFDRLTGYPASTS